MEPCRWRAFEIHRRQPLGPVIAAPKVSHFKVRGLLLGNERHQVSVLTGLD